MADNKTISAVQEKKGQKRKQPAAAQKGILLPIDVNQPKTRKQDVEKASTTVVGAGDGSGTEAESKQAAAANSTGEEHDNPKASSCPPPPYSMVSLSEIQYPLAGEHPTQLQYVKRKGTCTACKGHIRQGELMWVKQVNFPLKFHFPCFAPKAGKKWPYHKLNREFVDSAQLLRLQDQLRAFEVFENSDKECEIIKYQMANAPESQSRGCAEENS